MSWRAGALLLCLAAAAFAAEAATDDPYAEAQLKARIGNVEAGVPAQCYAKTGVRNSCYVCHQTPHRLNQADDADLQSSYDFSPLRRSNPWTNLFSAPKASELDTRTVLGWVRQDNYAALLKAAPPSNYRFWRPDIDLAQGFDEQGYARDGSLWRAFRYKPFPGGFWPTNGSADEVMIRLPPALREDAGGRFSAAIYAANLAIVEALIATPDSVADAGIDHAIEPIDERAAGLDLDGDGRLSPQATRLRGLPSRYAGRSTARPRRYVYPQGTEFLHTVRYLDPNAPDFAARRLKELRYAVKAIEIDDPSIAAHYAEDAREKLTGGRPHYAGSALTGQSNEYGWTLGGFIEDAQGRLRLQTREEQLFCMGCHTGAGSTVDQTFSLARKLPGAEGWGLQSLAGQRDRPQAGRERGEYAEYFERTGSGDDYQANTELQQRFFRNGRFDMQAFVAAEQAQGLRGLILPSAHRALALDAAYRRIVQAQGYRQGRDALLVPAQAHRELAAGDPAPEAAKQRYDDGSPWLSQSWARH